MKKLLKYILITSIIIFGSFFIVQAATYIFPYQGGLGTPIPPTTGQIPVGNSGGTYTPTSTISTDLRIDGSATTSGSFYIGNDLTVMNGKVGIGDTSPDSLLEVSASGGSDDLFMLSSDDTEDGDLFIVKNSGNVGIGTTTTLSAKLSIDPPEGSNALTMWSYGKDDNGEIFVLQNTNTSTKATIAFKDYNGDSKAWLTMHELSSVGDTHEHFSIETSDVSGALQSRFIVPYDCDYDCDITINQGNLLLRRNSGQTNGNMMLGGKFQHNNNFSFYPNYADNATYGLQIATSGNDVLIRAMGANELTIDDGLKIIGSATSSTYFEIGTGGCSNLNYAGGDLCITDDLEVKGGAAYFENTFLHFGTTNRYIQSDDSFSIYPQDSATIGLNINTDGSNLDLAAYGTTQIDINDNITISGNTTTTNHFAADSAFYVKDGKVGIGTATPEVKLHTVTAGENIIKSEATGASNDARFIVDVPQASGSYGTYDFFKGGVRKGQIYLGDNADNSIYISSLNDIILTRGKVGIGDTDPDAMFEVSASGGSDDLFMLSSDDTEDGDLFIVKNNGNVGIGTITPQNILHISEGGSATTTVQYGEIGDTTSKVCHNTKNTAGSDISFYFVGTTMIVENKRCN